MPSLPPLLGSKIVIAQHMDVLWLTPLDTITLAITLYCIMFVPLTGWVMMRKIERIAKETWR